MCLTVCSKPNHMFVISPFRKERLRWVEEEEIQAIKCDIDYCKYLSYIK